ncbi:STAS domain-containing protein [Streptomyces sp. NPDC006393]|uniref:STAS domain-containing protein n=1 Tax=Streptomyces sp. NPDC006393 TaxID=3156763 RepID=UPI0033EA9B0B
MRHSIFHDERLDLACYPVNGWTVVEVGGEVDVHTAPRIGEAVSMLLRTGHRHFVLDLCPVPILDSQGLGMLIAITKRIRDREGSLCLTCADERILKVFRATELRRVYAFYDSVEAATRNAPHRGGLAGWPRPLLR